MLPLLGGENHPVLTRRSSDMKIRPKLKFPKLPAKNLSVKERNPVSLPPLSSTNTSGDEDVFDASSTSVRRQKPLAEEPESAESLHQLADRNKLVSKLEKAIVEWKRSYSKRILQVIVTWLRSQLDQLRFSIVIPPNLKSAGIQQLPALFLLKASCQVSDNPTIEIIPSLDEIQDLLHSAGRIMISVTKGN